MKFEDISVGLRVRVVGYDREGDDLHVDGLAGPVISIHPVTLDDVQYIGVDASEWGTVLTKFLFTPDELEVA